jgi:hypothetical protein
MDDATPDGSAKSERKTTRASASQVNGSERETTCLIRVKRNASDGAPVVKAEPVVGGCSQVEHPHGLVVASCVHPRANLPRRNEGHWVRERGARSFVRPTNSMASQPHPSLVHSQLESQQKRYIQ